MEESKKENTCTLRRCKKFELSPVICKACKQTFCMEHRLEMDHNCPGKPVAAQRKTAKKKKQPKASSTQAQLDEVRLSSHALQITLADRHCAVPPREGSPARIAPSS